MGTWGGAWFFTSADNNQKLADEVGSEPFAALIETTFDPFKYEITGYRLLMAPSRRRRKQRQRRPEAQATAGWCRARISACCDRRAN
jgi:hypothetical protein